MAVTAVIRVVTDDAVPVPLDGVTCRVFTDPGDVFVTQGITGLPTPGSGETEVSLDGDGVGVLYLVRLSKDGVSFPPSATKNITIIDPPPPPNDFQFTAHVGETAVVVQMVVEDDQGTPQPVEDVRIRVFDAGDLFVTELETDSNGEADVVLDGDPDPGRNYIVRLFKSGWRFTNGVTQIIRVHEPLVAPATNVFDFEASQPTLPESAHPEMCLISGYIGNAARQALRSVTLRFSPQLGAPDAYVSGFPFPGDPTVVDAISLLTEAKAITDANGYLEVQLPRRGIFYCHIYGLETPGLQTVQQIYVPDSASARLEDVIFPFVYSVEWDESSLAVSVGETVDLVPTVTGSNDQPIAGGNAIRSLVEFLVDDESIIAAELLDDGTLRVTGIAPGTANITASRVDDTWAPRRPPIDDLVITPVTQVPVMVT